MTRPRGQALSPETTPELGRLADVRRRLHAGRGRGRKLRGMLELLRPYRGRTLLMFAALLADPRILILDDATSSVDASTEQQIKQALREVMQGRTTFVIAHRLSTIALADEIVVLEKGRIAARGSHDELLSRSPLYAEIAAKGLPDQVFLTCKPAEPEVVGL